MKKGNALAQGFMRACPSHLHLLLILLTIWKKSCRRAHETAAALAAATGGELRLLPAAAAAAVWVRKCSARRPENRADVHSETCHQPNHCFFRLPTG